MNVDEYDLSHEKLYNVYTEGQVHQTIYVKILLQRPYWQLASTINSCSLLLSLNNNDKEVYQQRGYLQIAFNHLPNSKLLLDYMRLFQTFQNKNPTEVFKHFRFAYNLGTEFNKFKMHMTFLQSQSAVGPVKQVSAQKQALKVNAKFNGLKMVTEQEQENDKIWGKYSTNTVSSIQRPGSAFGKVEQSLFKNNVLYQNGERQRPMSAQVQRVASSNRPMSAQNYRNPNTQNSVGQKQLTIAELKFNPPKSPQKLKQQLFKVQVVDKSKQKQETKQEERFTLEFSYTPIEQNLQNIWTITTQPPQKITHSDQVQPFFQNPGIYAIKECESCLKYQRRELTFSVFCLLTQSGDCYVYEKTLNSMESQGFEKMFEKLNRNNQYTTMKDADHVTDNQVDNLIDTKRTFSLKLKPQMFDSVKQFIKLFKYDLVNTAPCTNSFELLQFDFQIGVWGRGKFITFLKRISQTPHLTLNSAFAWNLYPKLVDDMYALTIDKVFKTEFLQPKRYKTTFETFKKQIMPQITLRTKQSESEIEDEEIWKKLIVDNRKLEGLRWSGGRNVNLFKMILQRWNEFKPEK
ncbi:Tubulin_tyrosine ligase-like 3 [Hexamita inflata]|uniref:Tubulin tyrosine ligase-like 3 n=1 Tax=Hexamita inflata TaxID=28002 RepID=A0AA86QP03_9EUKA|nr:Tubulin tyrosine ligase-like 3 [Hexamita inflata]